MRCSFVLAAAAALLSVMSAASTARAAGEETVRIGVLTDFSSVYQDNTGRGSLAAAEMAVADYIAAHPNSALELEVVSADHQHKPDIGLSTARRWFDQEGVEVIVELTNPAHALGVSGLASRECGVEGQGGEVGVEHGGR